MNWCDINLVRGMVYSKKKRLILHWSMTLYQAVSVILLILVTLNASKNIRKGFSFYQQADEIQERFQAQHPDKLSLTDFATELKKNLQQQAAETISISSALPARVKTALPLITALANQPDQSEIYNLVFIQQLKNKEPSLEFSLCLPIEVKPSPLFLEQWRSNDNLTAQIENIVPVTTKRGRVENNNVAIMSYQVEFRN